MRRFLQTLTTSTATMKLDTLADMREEIPDPMKGRSGEGRRRRTSDRRGRAVPARVRRPVRMRTRRPGRSSGAIARAGGR